MREPTRYCAYSQCGRPLVRKYNESSSRFRARQSCGYSCGAYHALEMGRGRGKPYSKTPQPAVVIAEVKPDADVLRYREAKARRDARDARDAEMYAELRGLLDDIGGPGSARRFKTAERYQ